MKILTILDPSLPKTHNGQPYFEQEALDVGKAAHLRGYKKPCGQREPYELPEPAIRVFCHPETWDGLALSQRQQMTLIAGS